MQTDSKGNLYTEIEHVRITYVKANHRLAQKNWPGMDVIRIQRYRDLNFSSLHRGAEIPVNNKEGIIEIVRKLLEIHKEI